MQTKRDMDRDITLLPMVTLMKVSGMMTSDKVMEHIHAKTKIEDYILVTSLKINDMVKVLFSFQMV